MKETTVRKMRLHFTGDEAFVEPVEVRAHGRLIGHWFPPGTISDRAARRLSTFAARRPAVLRAYQRGLRDRRVRRLSSPAELERAAPSLYRPTAADKRRAREQLLSRIVPRTADLTDE